MATIHLNRQCVSTDSLAIRFLDTSNLEVLRCCHIFLTLFPWAFSSNLLRWLFFRFSRLHDHSSPAILPLRPFFLHAPLTLSSHFLVQIQLTPWFENSKFAQLKFRSHLELHKCWRITAGDDGQAVFMKFGIESQESRVKNRESRIESQDWSIPIESHEPALWKWFRRNPIIVGGECASFKLAEGEVKQIWPTSRTFGRRRANFQTKENELSEEEP